MDSILEEKVADYLINDLHVSHYDCGTVIEKIRSLAQMAGHDLDERFAQASLGAGPEARVASAIVDHALLGGGAETPEYTIKKEIGHWLRTSPRKVRRR